MIADPGYDGKKLYDLSMAKGFQLVCPVKRYKRTKEERLKLVEFMSRLWDRSCIRREIRYRTTDRTHKISISE